MSPDEVETLTLIEELSDAELEAIVAGKDGPLGDAYSRAGRVGLIVSRATNLGAGSLAGLRGFGGALSSIGRSFALAGAR
jgi:hypothetical protein